MPNVDLPVAVAPAINIGLLPLKICSNMRHLLVWLFIKQVCMQLVVC